MKQTFNQNCPLCESPAKYYWVDFSNRKYFICPKCTIFQVSIAAEKLLVNGSQQWRDGYVEMASLTPDGTRLVIIVPSTPVDTGPRAAISSEYVKYDKLPQ